MRHPIAREKRGLHSPRDVKLKIELFFNKIFTGSINKKAEIQTKG